jgi:hypothetical protein
MEQASSSTNSNASTSEATTAARDWIATARRTERLGLNLSVAPGYAMSAGLREAGVSGLPTTGPYATAAAVVIGDMVSFPSGATLTGATARAFMRGYAAAAVSGIFSAHNAEEEALIGLRMEGNA